MLEETTIVENVCKMKYEEIMSDMDFVSENIYQIGRILRDNTIETAYLYYPKEWFGSSTLMHINRKLKPEYYIEIEKLYQKWLQDGKPRLENLIRDFLKDEKMWRKINNDNRV